MRGHLQEENKPRTFCKGVSGLEAGDFRSISVSIADQICVLETSAGSFLFSEQISAAHHPPPGSLFAKQNMKCTATEALPFTRVDLSSEIQG